MYPPPQPRPDEVLPDIPEVRTVHLRHCGRDALTLPAIEALHTALDAAEADPCCRLVVLVGGEGVFCTGLDLTHAAEHIGGEQGLGDGDRFFSLLRRLTSCSRVVVALVDGWASGGGVGLAAASDFVFSSLRSRFALPEALWGLVPCCVLPFLVRRVGIQRSYAMTLSTYPVDAENAHRIGLVDELDDDPLVAVRRLVTRVRMFDESVVGEVKSFCQALWAPSPEVEQLVRTQFRRLTTSETVRRRITDWASGGQFPWQRGGPSWSR